MMDASPGRLAPHGERGSALLVALMLVFVISIGTGATWHTMHREASQARAARQNNTCYYLAEAGIETAIANLKLNPNFRGRHDVALGEGLFDVTVTRIPFLPTYRIESTGRLQDGPVPRQTLTLDTVLRMDAQGKVLSISTERRRKQP